MGSFRALTTVRRRSLPYVDASTFLGTYLYAGASGQFYKSYTDPFGNVWIQLPSSVSFVSADFSNTSLPLVKNGLDWVAAYYNGQRLIQLF